MICFNIVIMRLRDFDYVEVTHKPLTNYSDYTINLSSITHVLNSALGSSTVRPQLRLC